MLTRCWKSKNLRAVAGDRPLTLLEQDNAAEARMDGRLREMADRCEQDGGLGDARFLRSVAAELASLWSLLPTDEQAQLKREGVA